MAPEPSWTASLTVSVGFEVAQMATVGKTIYAAEDWGSGRLALINAMSGDFKVVTTGVQGLSLVTDGSRLWLMGQDSSIYPDLTLAELNVRTGAAVRRAKVCPGESPPEYSGINMAVTSSGIEVLCKSGLLVEVDSKTLQTKRTLALPTDWVTGITDVNGVLWIGAFNNLDLRVDRATFTLLPSPSTDCPSAWTMWSYGSRVVCEGVYGQSVVYDATTLAAVSTLATPSTGYYATRTGGGVLISGYESGPVSMVDPNTAAIAWTHATGRPTRAGIFYGTSLWLATADGLIHRYPPATV